METKIDQILKTLDAIQEAEKIRSTGWFSRIFKIIEIALIPLTVAGLAYYGNKAATQIADGQLALARSAAEDRKAEFQRTIQSKYLELFYRDITSNDATQQASALALLKLLEPSLANDVATYVAANSRISAQIKAEVKNENQRVQAATQVSIRTRSSDVMNGYTVGIYYLSTDAAAEKTAHRIQSHLKQKLPGIEIRPYPSKPDFLNEQTNAATLEVRYDAGIEDKQAARLKALLEMPPIINSANLLAVSPPSPNFISVFVPAGG
ncbi:hypothetical protein [Variovorax sp. PMC12]|uniref:hypothetical protein n=1 Tax=Variovorax sp. PMC12 TaxID=2126319 RepID=UPI00131C1E68|nr:hypothetical protein [Variovorax sp. PMC12]